MHYLYRITNQVNGKVYIGQTVQPLHRWRQHKFDAKNKPKYPLHFAMIKYGNDNFIYEVIAQCKTIDDANLTEIELIKQYNSLAETHQGYNIEHGGKKTSRSEETKRKISLAHLGKKLSKEHVKALSISHMGQEVVHSEETRKKISESKKGKPQSEAHIAALTASRQNVSEETKAKMRAAKLGKPSPKKGKKYV